MISTQPNGLLTFTTPDGKAHRDLADDEVVRLAAKWAKMTTARETLQKVSELRTSAPGFRSLAKCSACGSTRPQTRRQRMGVTGSCQNPFHTQPEIADSGAVIAGG